MSDLMPNPPAAPTSNWVVWTMLGVTLATLGAMAVPQRKPVPALLRLSPETIEREQALVRAIEDWRLALQTYRTHHAVFPGHQPGRAGGYLHGPVDATRVLPQLLLSTNAWGMPGPIGMSGFPHRPCLSNGVPSNPINELSTLRVLGPQQAFPAQADDSTGWVYKPSTGELRANASGAVELTGQPYWEL
jgi:hypothetical protein